MPVCPATTALYYSLITGVKGYLPKINKLPKEDLTIYLHVPFAVSQKLLATKNGKEDMVEKDAVYLQNSEEAYNSLAKQFSHWETIECVDRKGSLRSVESINSDIKKLLAKRRILQ